MTVQSKHDQMLEARELVEQIDRSLRKQVGASVVTIHIDDLSSLTGHITAALAEIERLREVLEKIATTGRCEFATVRAALKGSDQ